MLRTAATRQRTQDSCPAASALIGAGAASGGAEGDGTAAEEAVRQLKDLRKDDADKLMRITTEPPP